MWSPESFGNKKPVFGEMKVKNRISTNRGVFLLFTTLSRNVNSEVLNGNERRKIA